MTASPETTATPLPALAPDTVLQGRYLIVKKLGKGGMGAVYEAIDQRLGITVALKETLSAEASVRKQFEQEARLLASMQHPALPRVSDYFLEGNRAFLVMQFIGGVDLARIIAQQPGPFPKAQVIAWADQLLDALMYLHSRDRQVIHRDIKPHNLKLTSSGQIALLDFGLAKAQPADPSVTASLPFFGYTRQYAPLEQIQDRRSDPRSDIYALGATLYHLLTGHKPTDALVRAAAVINGEPDPLRPANQIHRLVGQEIAAILMKAMAQKPEDRFASASEFREALRRVGRKREAAVEIGSESTAEAPQELPLKIEMIVSRKRFGPGSATALILLAMVGVVSLYGLRDRFDASTEAASLPVAAVQTKQPIVTTKNSRAPELVSMTRSKIVTEAISTQRRKEPPSSPTGRVAKKTQLLNAPTIRLPAQNAEQ